MKKSNKHPRVLFHIPHDGCAMPAELMQSVCIPEAAFHRYHEEMRDRAVTELVPPEFQTAKNLLAFPISRLLCDVERFLGPEEIMEQYGMGYCYEKVYDGTVIKTITPALLEKTGAFYHAHHRKLDRIAMESDSLRLIDLHSYSAQIVPAAQRPKNELPEICIGADEVHTPARLIRAARQAAQEMGFSAAVNVPYQGTMVPGAVLRGQAKCDCEAIMLEIDRHAYLDAFGEVIPDAKQRIQEVLRRVAMA